MEKKKKLTKLCNCDFQTLDMRHHKIQTSWALQLAPPNCVELFLSHNTERKLKKNQSVPLHLGCWVRSAGILSHLEMSGHNTGEEKATQRKSSGCVQRFSPVFCWELVSRLSHQTASKTTFEVCPASPQRQGQLLSSAFRQSIPSFYFSIELAWLWMFSFITNLYCKLASFKKIPPTTR